MSKIVGIGAAVFDTLYLVAAYPKEDTKTRAAECRTAGGGPVATGLVAARKLGADAAYIGCLADDSAGVFLKRDFETYGVETDLIEIKKGYRSFTSTLFLSAGDGTRTCVYDRGDLPPLVLNEAQKRAIRNAEILMVDGNERDAALEGMRIARETGTAVLYDCGGLYEGVEQLLKLTDFMIPSEEFALGITGKQTAEDAAAALYALYSPRVVVITQGKRGGIFFDGKEFCRYPVFPVEAVDSNGAGDVFHGAFAAGLAKGYPPYACCFFASAASALKCRSVGARESAPDFETVEAFLKENNYMI